MNRSRSPKNHDTELSEKLSELISYRDWVEVVSLRAAHLHAMLEFSDRGGGVALLLDTAEVVRHFLPSSEWDMKREPSGSYINQRLSLAFLFSVDSPLGERGVGDLVLLPPYEIELADYLARLKARVHVGRAVMSVQPRQYAEILKLSLGDSLSDIVSIAERHKEGETLTDEDVDLVREAMSTGYPELSKGLWYLEANLGAELHRFTEYMREIGRLINLDKYVVDKNLALDVDEELIWEHSYELHRRLFQRKHNDLKTYPNCRCDAFALQYVHELNKQLHPNNAAVLITHSESVIEVGQMLKSAIPLRNGEQAPAVAGLHYVLTFLFLLQIDDDGQYNRKKTQEFARQLSISSREFLEQYESIKDAVRASPNDLELRKFLGNLSSTEIANLHEFVIRCKEQQIGIKGIEYLKRLMGHAEESAEALGETSSRVVYRFLRLVCQDRSVIRANRRESRRLIRAFGECEQALKGIVQIGVLNPRIDKEKSLKGYVPTFRSTKLRRYYRTVVRSLTSADARGDRIQRVITSAYRRCYQDPELRVLLAFVLAKLGDLDTGIAQIRTAIPRCSEPIAALRKLKYMLVLLLRLNHQYEDAMREITLLMEEHPESSEDVFVLRELAILLFKLHPDDLGDIDRALSYTVLAKEKAQLNPGLMPYLINNLAYLHAKRSSVTGERGDIELAEQSLSELQMILGESDWLPHFLHTKCVVLQAKACEMKNDGSDEWQVVLREARDAVRQAIEKDDYHEFLVDLNAIEEQLASCG